MKHAEFYKPEELAKVEEALKSIQKANLAVKKHWATIRKIKERVRNRARMIKLREARND